MKSLKYFLVISFLGASVQADSLTTNAKGNVAVAATTTPAQVAAKPMVKLKMELEVDGAIVAHPHASLQWGELGTINQRVSDSTSYVIEMTPTQNTEGEITVALSIDKTVSGMTSHLASPKVVTTSGNEVSVEQRMDNGEHWFRLRLTPTL